MGIIQVVKKTKINYSDLKLELKYLSTFHISIYFLLKINENHELKKYIFSSSSNYIIYPII